MKKLVILALVLSAVLLSCTPPPFNLTLTQAAITASRMTFAGEVGPIDNFSTGMATGDIAFYPEKDPATGFTLQSGFISWTWQSSSQQIAFVASSGGGSGYRVVANPQGLGMNNLDPPYPGFVIQSLKGGHTNVVFSWDAGMSSRFKSTLMTGDPVGNTYSPPAFADMSPPFIAPPFSIPASNAHIRHVGIYPDPNPGNDRVYALIKNTFSNRFEEAQFDLSQVGLTNPIRIRSIGINLTAAIGPIPQHSLYYFDPLSSTGFMNWYDAPTSAWVTWKWIESPPASGTAVASQLPGISHRIDALLTTGELFGTEGGVGRVYDQNGNKTAEFTLTGLSFVGEVYVAGEAQLLFSQALWFDNQLHFNLYSIPSQKVKSLQP